MTDNSVDLGIPGVTLAQRIGSGGNAIVYRARQPELDRAVVVKVLMVGDADVTQRRFDRERRAMGRLSQAQGIAPVYDSGFTGTGQPYLIMPYYEHGSLQDQLELTGRLSTDDVRRIGVEICDAVQTAHDHGVLHRDLKPANILITRSGRADVADFGIAQILDDSGGRSQAVTMTPLYTAPEVFDGAAPGRSADVYSLGALLYALLNGRPAHADTAGNASVLSLMMKIKDQPLPALPDDVPTDLAAVVAKAMHKDTHKRFGSAADVAAALRSADLTPPRRSRRRASVSSSEARTQVDAAPARTRSLRVGTVLKALAALVGLAAVAVGFVYFWPSGGQQSTPVTPELAGGVDGAPKPTDMSTPTVVAETEADVAGQVEVEAYSCGGVERSRGVMVSTNVVLTSEAIGRRPWRTHVIYGGQVVSATVVSFDEELGLASLQLNEADPPLEAPRLGRAIDEANARARTPDGSTIVGQLAERADGTFDFESSAERLEHGSAVTNESGRLIGIVSEDTQPRVVPLVGAAIEGWQATASDRTCADRGVALGTADMSEIASPELRELLQLQRLSEALAAEDWESVRQIELAKSELDDQAFVEGWGPLEQSFLYPVERDEISESRVRWRLGLIGHERWDGEDLTTLFCVWWEVDPATGSVIETNKDTVRVFGPQAGDARRSGWVDPGSLLGSVASEC